MRDYFEGDRPQAEIADFRAKRGAAKSLTYEAGGLENAGIRKSVCDLLEGGEAAFRERARRLRVRLER